MYRIYALIAMAWLALMPPLFTGGACTSEYEAVNSRVEAGKKQLLRPESALQFLKTSGAAMSLISAADCKRVKPRFLTACGDGPLIYAEVPIQNKVCRFYRDDAVKIVLQYDEHRFLSFFSINMTPYKILPLPWGGAIYWAR